MKVVFHENFHRRYTGDPAAAKGRLIPAESALARSCEFVEAALAGLDDIARVHGEEHIAAVRRETEVFELALLAAGGSIQAATIAAAGCPSFALVRPPGHHASPDSCWGFCYFNNVAVAIEALLASGSIRSALILDIDLHFGDGTHNFFEGRDDVEYLHPEADTRYEWLTVCQNQLERAAPADILAISAGFDRHSDDWGETLETEDYREVGLWASEWAGRNSGGKKPFAVLEGGYNPKTLAQSAVALAEGMK